jgi:hypothetical protein
MYKWIVTDNGWSEKTHKALKGKLRTTQMIYTKHNFCLENIFNDSFIVRTILSKR